MEQKTTSLFYPRIHDNSQFIKKYYTDRVMLVYVPKGLKS